MQTFSIIAIIIAIISYWLVARKDIRGIYGWFISNTILLILAIIRKDVGQIGLWISYNILNVYGFINWRKINESEGE